MRPAQFGGIALAHLLGLVAILSGANPKWALCAERFSSVEELATWSQEAVKFVQDLDRLIEMEESRVAKLSKVREVISFARPTSANAKSGDCHGQIAEHRRLMSHPVNAFVTINRLDKARRQVLEIMKNEHLRMHASDSDEEDAYLMNLDEIVDSIRVQRANMPADQDLAGSGEALLRLQMFYDLNTTELIGGLPLGARDQHAPLPTYTMNAYDCYELAKVAYDKEQFAASVIWFHAALELAVKNQESLDTSSGPVADEEYSLNRLIDDTLDHMSYAAYKLDLVEYSAKLTRAWLKRDPDNRRAQANLNYYLEEMATRFGPESDETPGASMGPDKNGVKPFLPDYKNLDLERYLVEDDEFVRRLCRQSEIELKNSRRGRCELGPAIHCNGHFYPGLRIETLSDEPKIVRLHEVMTTREADHLRDAARPRLERSTIMASGRLQASPFRIAKSAWLSDHTDEVVGRIERRLAAALNLDMEESELLQVVNYGLGGFYGPHLDSARVSSLKRNESLLASQLVGRSDRLATILMYLNDVDAGGATVFPHLNLTVEPIGRSAVVWFNILASGYSDERTLHCSCPVLLGQKWVATKWPHERANSFRRVCTMADVAQ